MSDHNEPKAVSAEEKERIAKRNKEAMASIARKQEARERAGVFITSAASSFGERASRGVTAKIVKGAPFALGALLLVFAIFLFFGHLAG